MKQMTYNRNTATLKYIGMNKDSTETRINVKEV